MSAQAKILIDGLPGSNVDLVLGQTVELSNEDDGEVSYHEWMFLSVPPGSEAELSDENDPSPSFVADKVGSYLIQLNVNDGESYHTEIACVRGVRTEIRIPAYKEQTEFGGQGWAESRYRDLMFLERIMGSGAPVVCNNKTLCVLTRGMAVKLTTAVSHDPIPIPGADLASGGDSGEILGIVVGGLEGESDVDPNGRVLVSVMGPVLCDTSAFVPGCEVYLGTPGTIQPEGTIRIGKCLSVGPEGCVFVYPTGGAGETPQTYDAGIYPRFILAGGPLDEYPLGEPIDGRYPIPEAGFLRWVVAVRSTPGDSGQTIANVFLNGASLLLGDNRIRFQPGSEDQIGYALLNQEVSVGDLLDVRLEGVEDGFAEDLCVVAFIHVPSPATRMEFRTNLLGPLDVVSGDVPLSIERFTVPLDGTIRSFGMWRKTSGDSGSTGVKLVRIREGAETVLTLGGNNPRVGPIDGTDAVDFASDFVDRSVQTGDVLEVQLTSVEDGEPEDIMCSVTVEAVGTPRSTYPFSIFGELSIPDVPFRVDGVYVVPEDGEIARVSAHRRVPGTGGRTTFDIRVSGTSIFTDGPYPYPGSGGVPAPLPYFEPEDSVIHVEDFAITEVEKDDLVEVFVVDVEDGHPEDLFVTVMVNT